jgi:phenylpyruvate tautomerase PptA (4-oxalocrotonate tautomerase family)
VLGARPPHAHIRFNDQEEQHMPYWEIFTPENAFTKEDKEQLSNAITQMYVDWVDLPRFYVVVRFHEMPDDSIYVGGVAKNNFVRVVIDHIARRMDDPEFRALCMAAIETALEPFVKERGHDWEVHVDETPMDLWRVQGLTPPAPFSDEEKFWARENRAVPYELATP